MDREYVKAQIRATAEQMRAAGQYVNPSVFNDTDYWADRILEQGGWGDFGPEKNNIKYFSGRFGEPEGAPAGGGLPGGFGLGNQTGGGKYPLSSFSAPGLLAPWTTPFEAPTDITMQNDPGYQARLKLGTDAILTNKAAAGTFLTGGTGRDLTQYAQDFASNEYDKIYNRAFGEYNAAYGIWDRNQNNTWNRLYGLSNMGLNATGGFSNAGSSYGRDLYDGASDIGDTEIDKGNAEAGNQVGQADAWGDFWENVGQNVSKAYQWNKNKKQNKLPGSTPPYLPE